MNGIASQQLKVKLSKYHALPLIYQIIRSGEISAYRIIMFCLVICLLIIHEVKF
jgi:hypothetical protein